MRCVTPPLGVLDPEEGGVGYVSEGSRATTKNGSLAIRTFFSSSPICSTDPFPVCLHCKDHHSSSVICTRIIKNSSKTNDTLFKKKETLNYYEKD